MGKRKEGERKFSLSICHQNCTSGRCAWGSIRLFGVSAYQKFLYLEFAKMFGSNHKFVARRSLITCGKLLGEFKYRSFLFNSSMNLQQLKKLCYVIKTVRIYRSIHVINLCFA